MDDQQVKQLYNLMMSITHVFGTKHSVTRISKLPAMKSFPKEGILPFKCQARKQGKVKIVAMREKIEELLLIETLEPDDNPTWGSPAFLLKNHIYLVKERRDIVWCWILEI